MGGCCAVRGHWFYALFYGFASQGLLAKELCIFHSCLDHRGCHLVRFATLAGCLNQSLCGVHHPIDLLLRERWRAAHWLRQLLGRQHVTLEVPVHGRQVAAQELGHLAGRLAFVLKPAQAILLRLTEVREARLLLLHALLQDSLHDLLDRHGCCVLSEIEV